MIDREINPNPIAQGTYVPVTRTDNMIFTAGMTPRKNGILIKSGKIKLSESLEDYKEAVIQATANTITASRNLLVEGEEIVRILSLSVYVNAEEGFISQSKLADFASEFLYEELGDAGIGARAAIGVASLPGDAPVEVQMVALIKKI